MKILGVVIWLGATICSWASSEVATQATLVGDLCVYHLDGTTSEYPVSLCTGAEMVVEIEKGVKVHARIGEQAEFGNLVRVDHQLERPDGTIDSLSWVGIPRSNRYHFGICESLYRDDSRWNVKKRLTGTVPGELRILNLDDSSKQTVKFEVDLERATELSVTADLKFVVAASWAQNGLVTYVQYFERRSGSGDWVKIELPAQGMLPGSDYFYETTDFFVYQKEKRPNQALLPTPTAVTPAATHPSRQP